MTEITDKPESARRSRSEERKQGNAAQIIPRLPKSYAPHDGEPVPDCLIGAKIIGIGTFADDRRFQGGGLVIEYVPATSTNTRRIVFEFDEREMHKASDEEVTSFASLDDCMRR